MTKEEKDFIVLVSKEYINMGSEAKIEIKIGPIRTKKINYEKNIIYVGVMNQDEADMLEKMVIHVNKGIQNKEENIGEASTRPLEETNLNEFEMSDEEIEELKRPDEPDTSFLDELLEKEYLAQLCKKFEEPIAEKSHYKKTETKVTKNNKKRDLKSTFKRLTNKTYRLSKALKEKALKVKEYIKENKKKVIPLIVASGVVASVMAYGVKTLKEGYDTYEVYDSKETIQLRMENIIKNEFIKALNNDDIELELDPIPAHRDEVEKLKITVVDPNDPNFEMSFVVEDSWNVSYMKRISEYYRDVKNIKENEESGRIKKIIDKARIGSKLDKTEEKAKEKDLVVKTKNEGSIYEKSVIRQIPERESYTGEDER